MYAVSKSANCVSRPCRVQVKVKAGKRPIDPERFKNFFKNALRNTAGDKPVLAAKPCILAQNNIYSAAAAA